MHRISTIIYRVKRVMGFERREKTEQFILDGLSESLEPSQSSVNNILSFSKAYKHEKSEHVGDIEYLMN